LDNEDAGRLCLGYCRLPTRASTYVYGHAEISALDAMTNNDDAVKAMVYSRVGSSANLLAREYEDSRMRGVNALGKPINPTKGFKAFAEEDDA